MDPVAIWGAVTGTIGAAVALRREVHVNRRRLSITPGVHFNVSRKEPGEITHGWACVRAWNSGGRDISVEHVGFQYLAQIRSGSNSKQALAEMRAEITLNEPFLLAADGPSVKVYTPLGPLLVDGVSPVHPIQAFAITTGDREWMSVEQPLLSSLPPTSSLEQLERGLDHLRDTAEQPPVAGNLIWLNREEPFLPEE